MAKLADPYGSPPGKPAKYALYITREGDDDTQSMVVTFGARFSARKFLDVLLRDDEIEWQPATQFQEEDTTIVSSSGIIVSTRWWPGRLRRCVEHEYSLPEMTWDLDRQHVRWAKEFREGPNMPRTIEEAAGARPAKERRSSAPRASAPAGYVHVSDVALSMGIDSKQARVALRKLYPDGKPAVGWNFPPDEVDALKARIKEVLK